MSAVGISMLEDNEDVLTEILLRLPVKSALRVRTVSKHWRRVATSPYFLTAYSLRRPQEIIVFHYLDEICAAPIVRDDDGSKVMFRHLGLNGDPGVVDCRDGLLVMSRGDDRLLVVNPATGQKAPSSRRPSLHEVFTAGNSNYYVLSTGAAEARRLAVDASMKCSEPPSMPGDVLLHGILHWLILLTHPTDKSGAASDEKLVVVDKMLAFDTVSETFRLMEPPSVPTGSGGY
ncbi:uncharacterized protein LOC104581942 [Brachypodium distachyon]|uniref:uncharacterized protein LOC104581942 n=1 Tax=Brachypodium distachyon TaxID=15368 RepID=UPI00052FE92E|nr:uncharacterized protein LOC104581942 [Brachypodium distachyon]|eukprot:XP_010229434.1 uncharacterized protein LOC104581942 [Brachypodium distachyon]